MHPTCPQIREHGSEEWSPAGITSALVHSREQVTGESGAHEGETLTLQVQKGPTVLSNWSL